MIKKDSVWLVENIIEDIFRICSKLLYAIVLILLGFLGHAYFFGESPSKIDVVCKQDGQIEISCSDMPVQLPFAGSVGYNTSK